MYKYIIIMLVISLLSLSCISKGFDKQHDKFNSPNFKPETNNNVKSDTQTGAQSSTSYAFEMLPLTLNQYNEFKSNLDTFSSIKLDIDYIKNDSPYIGYHPSFIAGNLAGSRIFSDINNFECKFAVSYRPPNPYYLCGYKFDFTPSQMESIFDHIETFHEYYFNNEEFSNLQLPYVTTSELLEQNKKYNFTLFFSEPNPVMGENLQTYAIIKSSDELTLGSPLYELIQLFETEYYPTLIENEIYCQ